MSEFNRIAGIYDLMKRLVFGKALDKAVEYYLGSIADESTILILGGGKGEFLRFLKPSQEVHYVDSSSLMLSKAQKIKSPAQVTFICSDIRSWQANQKFDVIMSPFVLDCFTETELDTIFNSLKKSLKAGGKWIQTDFYPKERWHHVLVKLMYSFFRITVGLSATQLSDFDRLFHNHNFFMERNALFFHSMVESRIYKDIG